MTITTRRDFVGSMALVPLALSAAETPKGADEPVAERKQGARVPSSEQFDYVVAGAGHNSLICAAYLARAGYRVLVLEAREMIGGGAKTVEMLLPGFKQDPFSSAHHVLARNPLVRNNELNLRDHGYETFEADVVVHYPFRDGASFSVFLRDPGRTAESIAGISKNDAETFRKLAAARARVKRMPAAESASSREGIFFSRIGVLSGYAAARQIWESPYLQAASLSGGLWPGFPGSDPGTGGQAFSVMDHMEGRPMPKGGSGMLSVALGRVIEAHHGVILVNKTVRQLMIESGRCVGVACSDGSSYRAGKAVVSTLHVKHLAEMAPREAWGDAFLDTVEMWQPEMGMFAFHYALSESPRYRVAGGGTITSGEASVMQRPESIFALNTAAARRELSLDDVPLQVIHPSAYDASRAPAGAAGLKIIGPMPYSLKEGPQHWDAIKDQVADRILNDYLRHTANLSREKVLAKSIASPLDIERMNPAMWRCSVHHMDKRWGNFAPYRMPIPGLYQTGGCTEAGGSITGVPGRTAAAVILQDEGKSLAQVVAHARS